MKISVVTPWLEHPELLADYAQAVNYGKPDEVIVVDNGGFPFDAESFHVPVRVLTQSENRGFSRACNIGMYAAEHDAVLFLNNDIVPTRSDWLEVLKSELEPGVLVGARLRYDFHGNVDGQALPYLDGWCLAGMRDDLLDLDGFDEGYEEPAYFSDNDLCLRARVGGLILREVRIGLRHKENVTAGPASDPVVRAASEANYKRYSERARKLVMEAV